MYHFLICDSNEAFCEKEKNLIEKYFDKKGINVSVDAFLSGQEIIDLGDKVSKYNAVFLDVSMENVNGIDLAKWLKAAFDEMIIVLVSGYMSYALDGYKVGATRYIMKDDENYEDEMEECLSHILKSTKKDKYVVIGDEKLKISADKILYVESKQHKIFYYLQDCEGVETPYSVYGKLDDIGEELVPLGFCRTHQSYLVNMKYVVDVKRYDVTLFNDMVINISKKYYKAVEAEFIKTKGTF